MNGRQIATRAALHIAALLLVVPSTSLLAQALPTASRRADAQIGAGFTLGHSGYEHGTFRGLTAYAGLDLRPHLGVEIDFHQINSRSSNKSYQRTYEIGPRYFRTYGVLIPYIRGMYGRGNFNYPYGLTDLPYNVFSAAGGADFKLNNSLRLRADYEYQSWLSFPNGGLHPQLVTIGIAYHPGGNAGLP